MEQITQKQAAVGSEMAGLELAVVLGGKSSGAPPKPAVPPKPAAGGRVNGGGGGPAPLLEAKLGVRSLNEVHFAIKLL